MAAAFTNIEQVVINSCKSDNAVNSAILMNPTNYSFLPNQNIPDNYFHKGGISHGIVLKTVPGTPESLFCSAGISAAFGLCNGDMVKCGGYPKDSSSQIVYNKANFFSKKFVFKPEEHYELGKDIHQGFLTESGVNLFREMSKLKGAVYSVRKKGGTGHIGIVMAAELGYIPHPVNKYRGWLYTIEYNTKNGTPNKLIDQLQYKSQYVIQTLSKEPVNYYDTAQKKRNPNYVPSEKEGDERSGGKLAFRSRLIGGLWFCDPATLKVDEVDHVTIASTETFKGGIWAPDGLSSPNYFDFFGLKDKSKYKTWKDMITIFEP